MLTKNTPDLSDIVVFGSPCTVHVDAKNKSLGKRGKPGMIVGKSDEIKGYRVYIPRDKIVVVTQHVSNVETLSDVQNEQLKRVHLDDSEESGGGGLFGKEDFGETEEEVEASREEDRLDAGQASDASGDAENCRGKCKPRS
ncbi:hypothetical protein PC128_g8382 [Phytophthora cactorum]|nr:hypothetical protein PC128_g8382 [Phytophthora cactorum]